MSRRNEMEMKKENLQKEIEKTRKKLHAAIANGINTEETYEKSKEMDRLIVRYMEMKK